MEVMGKLVYFNVILEDDTEVEIEVEKQMEM